MPSANLGTVETLHAGENLVATLEGHPVKDLRRTFRKNIHKANRIAKEELAKALKRTLTKGVPGEGYNKEYAERKNRDPRAFQPTDSGYTGGPYSSAGPVDFKYSGRLWDELVGRGRPKPSEDLLQMWVGLRSRGKSRPKSAPGSFSNYGQLVDHLQSAKRGTRGNPFNVDPKEREKIAENTIRRLLTS